MHVCIVGNGAAGWMAAHWFNFCNPVRKITIIGSPDIPPIGVGESNTLNLNKFLAETYLDIKEFIVETDAVVKTGVYYKGWSPHNFIHNFKSGSPWTDYNVDPIVYWQSMGNKPTDQPIHHYYSGDLLNAINNNNLLISERYPVSYQFDAGKFISYLTKKARTYGKIKTIDDTVVNVNKVDGVIKSIQTKEHEIVADYYIFATGQHSNLIDTEFVSLSNTLLTNKAWVYPLPFTNKRDQFTPYTTAKTMKYGWRWITPTQSRIGTGYVFSSNHISEDEARDEFILDVRHDIEPKLVEFIPRYAKQSFFDNYCTIGMANGFLEPLDAPGLSITIGAFYLLQSIFINIHDRLNAKQYMLDVANSSIEESYKFWSTFILTQYKTSWRDDSQFWKDHKEVQSNTYDQIIGNYNDTIKSSSQTLVHSSANLQHYIMMYHTIAAKDRQWKLGYNRVPFQIPDDSCKTIHHLDYINNVIRLYYSEAGATDNQ